MNNTARRAAVQACVGALVVAAPLTVAGTAQAVGAGPETPNLFAHSSDSQVQPGQQFVLRGRMTTAKGRQLSGATVRVKTLRPGANPDMNSSWESLPGAVVTTDDTGHFSVRVVLSRAGERQLQVVGNPRGDRLPNGSHALTIMVRR